jgi:hypothetical protein
MRQLALISCAFAESLQDEVDRRNGVLSLENLFGIGFL